jgi:hypothetical protein
MFWTHEDLAPIYSVISKVFGPQGRYSTVDSKFFNVRIMSDKYGTLWYGDFDTLQDITTKCSTLKSQAAELTHDTIRAISSTDRELARF